MKKTFFFKKRQAVMPLLFASVSMILAACSFNKEDESSSTIALNSITTDKQELELGVEGGTGSFRITSSCAKWQVEVADVITPRASTWLSVDMLEGAGEQTITVTAQRNLTGEDRTATVKVVGKYNEIDVVVTQLGDTPQVLSLDKQSLLFTAVPDNTQAIAVTAQFGFTAAAQNPVPAPVQGTDPWYSFTPASAEGNATVTVTLTPNDTGAERSVTLVFTSPTGKEEMVEIFQLAADEEVLEVMPRKLTFGALETNPESFIITATGDWTISADGLAGNVVNGFTLSAVSGTGNQTINVTPTLNGTGAQRTAALTITSGTSGTLTRTVDLLQLADAEGILEVTPVLIDFPGFNATMQLLTLTSAFDWTIDATEAEALGFTFNKKSGTGSPTGTNVEITPPTPNNESASVISTTITISNSAKSVVVTLKQELPVFTIAPRILQFAAVGASRQSFTVTSDLPWEITNAATATTNGFTVETTSGTGGSAPVEVFVTAADNTTGLVRAVDLFIKAGDVIKDVGLGQAAAAFSSNHSNLAQFAATNAAAQEFTLTSELDWSIEITGADATAFSVTPTGGSGSATATTIEVSVAGDNAGVEKNATIVISNTATPAQTIQIPVSQAAIP